MQYLVLYQSCSLRSKTLDIPQNLSNQIVLKVLNAKLRQSSEIYFLRICPAEISAGRMFLIRDFKV